MLSKILTASLLGTDADLVTVETDLQPGLPAMNLVGLAGATIREAKERIRAAVLNSGYDFPRRRITVNLSPAGKPKEGSHFDLPIAMGILLLDSGKEIPAESMAFIGELSLDGDVKHIRGALPLAIGLRERGIRKLVLPIQNIEEVALLKDMALFPVKNLKESVEYANGQKIQKVHRSKKRRKARAEDNGLDFSDVVGQDSAKRAITVAAAGNHGILMMGSPGSGKTMMARRIPTIMPEMSYEEQLEVTKLHSAAGLLSEANPAVDARPFRAPHHTISGAALIGGGRKPVPGEISLAHNGILFLDELGEFGQAKTELLRQPAEDEQVAITRCWGTVTFPCRAMIVAAANPCRCGYLGDDSHICTCSEQQLSRYFAGFSGPVLDRIDLHVKVLPVPSQKIGESKKGLSSAELAKQVDAAAAIQAERYRNSAIRYNSRLKPQQILEYCPMSKEAESFLKEAYEKLKLNLRTYYKIIKVARTIADLHEINTINPYHIAEALQYRALDRFYRRSGRGD